MTRYWLIAAAAALAVTVGAGSSMAHPTGDPGTPAANGSGQLVPDLVQILPSRVGIATRRSVRGPRTLLTFPSEVRNLGSGPMIVRARRPNRSTATMTGTQVVARTDGRRDAVGGPLRLRFVRGGGHSHWHLEDFQRFELRTVAGTSLRRDRKTGFCLGDRFDATGAARIAGEPLRPIYRAECGRSRPDLLSFTQGISVGYGDVYPARLEGQFIDITGLPTARYVLVLRMDPNGALMDLHEDNDVSSMLVKVVRGARTRARILSWCSGRETCPTPGVMRR